MTIRNLVLSFLKSNINYPIKAWQIQDLVNTRDLFVNPETLQREFRRIKNDATLLAKEGISIKELPSKNRQSIWQVIQNNSQLSMEL